jgi:WD40 repeat protein
VQVYLRIFRSFRADRAKNSKITLYNLSGNNLTASATLEAHRDQITRLAFSPVRVPSLFLSLLWHLYQYMIPNCVCAASSAPCPGSAPLLSALQDGKHLASADKNREILIWPVDAKEVPSTFFALPLYSPDFPFFLVKLTATCAALLHLLPFVQPSIRGWVFHNARVNDLAWHSDSIHLASVSLDQVIHPIADLLVFSSLFIPDLFTFSVVRFPRHL